MKIYGRTNPKLTLASDFRGAAHAARRLRQRPGQHAGRALLLTGFAGALRRSELVALDITDLRFGKDGVIQSILLVPDDTARIARAASQGIEGTISKGVRNFGLRQSCYRGLATMSLQSVAKGLPSTLIV